MLRRLRRRFGVGVIAKVIAARRPVITAENKHGWLRCNQRLTAPRRRQLDGLEIKTSAGDVAAQARFHTYRTGGREGVSCRSCKCGFVVSPPPSKSFAEFFFFFWDTVANLKGVVCFNCRAAPRGSRLLSFWRAATARIIPQTLFLTPST